MKLTDEDRAALRTAIDAAAESADWEADVRARHIAIYLAGKRAGAEAMRERAAKACDDLHNWQTTNNQEYPGTWHQGVDSCAAAIRALPLPGDSDE